VLLPFEVVYVPIHPVIVAAARCRGQMSRRALSFFFICKSEFQFHLSRLYVCPALHVAGEDAGSSRNAARRSVWPVRNGSRQCWRIRAAKPKKKPYKLRDGRGLHLLVTPGGARLWRLRFRHSRPESMVSLGAYPEVSLKLARVRREDARKLVASGVDPASQRRGQQGCLPCGDVLGRSQTPTLVGCEADAGQVVCNVG
jgi:hypothetical protein